MPGSMHHLSSLSEGWHRDYPGRAHLRWTALKHGSAITVSMRRQTAGSLPERWLERPEAAGAYVARQETVS